MHVLGFDASRWNTELKIAFRKEGLLLNILNSRLGFRFVFICRGEKEPFGCG